MQTIKAERASRTPSINRPGGDSPNFKGYSRPEKDRPEGTSSPGSGYTPGGDSFQNYSQKDQALMFNQAGGKDKFIDQAIATQEKYPRGLDYQKFLDRAKQYQAGLLVGGQEVLGPDGIMRLQMAGADTPMRDAQDRQILSMMAPELTAQAPTLQQFLGDVGGGINNLFSTGADYMLGGGTFGKILEGVKEKYGQGKEFLSGVFNPGNINERVAALNPEQRRAYTMYMIQGMPYQRAFEMATGQQFASGGITTL